MPTFNAPSEELKTLLEKEKIWLLAFPPFPHDIFDPITEKLCHFSYMYTDIVILGGLNLYKA